MRFFAVTFIAVASCWPGLGSAQDGGDPPSRPVKTATIGEGRDGVTRQFFGKVRARQTVDLGFQVSGQLLEFPVVEGASIAEGGLIAALDLEPFELALDRAEAEQAQADRALSRLEQLSANSRSQAALEDAQTAAQLAGIAVRDAERALELATLAAPFDGLVAARNVANFTTVQAGTPVVRLHDVSEWRVEIEVPEQLFRQVNGANRGGPDNIDLTLRFPGEDRTIALVPREFNAEASPVGQSFSITLAMQQDPGPGILPGTAATVVARLRSPDAAAALPPSAVVIAPDGGTSVMVFDPSGDDGAGTVSSVAVEVEAGPDGEFLLRGGLEPGTEIVVAGANRLRDGQAVRRFTGLSN